MTARSLSGCYRKRPTGGTSFWFNRCWAAGLLWLKRHAGQLDKDSMARWSRSGLVKTKNKWVKLRGSFGGEVSSSWLSHPAARHRSRRKPLVIFMTTRARGRKRIHHKTMRGWANSPRVSVRRARAQCLHISSGSSGATGSARKSHPVPSLSPLSDVITHFPENNAAARPPKSSSARNWKRERYKRAVSHTHTLPLKCECVVRI